MHATSGTNDKARVGDAFPTLELAATSGQQVTVPDPCRRSRPSSAAALRRLPDLQPSPTLDRQAL